jgi:hypothetical protein
MTPYNDGEQEQSRVQDEGDVMPRRAVAQAVAHFVAQVQAMLAVGEQQLGRAGPVLIEPRGRHRGDQRSQLAHPAGCPALRDVDHRDVAAALDLAQ